MFLKLQFTWLFSDLLQSFIEILEELWNRTSEDLFQVVCVDSSPFYSEAGHWCY